MASNETETEKTLTWLLPFYSQPSELNPSSLNTALRKCLRMFAASHRLKFNQDNIGNIYITSPGRDPEISPLAIAFPLDSACSAAAFEGAIRTFLAIQNRNLGCDVTLLGWSSPGGREIGREVWTGDVSSEDAHAPSPELKQFTSMGDVLDMPLSALFEIVVTDSDEVGVQGSPVLVQKVVGVSKERVVRTKAAVSHPRRAPAVRIEGREASEVGSSAVEAYSRYVAALFENFD